MQENVKRKKEMSFPVYARQKMHQTVAVTLKYICIHWNSSRAVVLQNRISESECDIIFFSLIRISIFMERGSAHDSRVANFTRQRLNLLKRLISQ